MEIKDYWFALKSFVYVELKKERMLLNDTKSGNRIITSRKDSIDLVLQLYDPKNLGVTFLSKDILMKPDIAGFVGEVLEKKMGDITDTKKFIQKPVRLIPILNLQKDVDKMKKNKENYTLMGDDAKKYLMELNISLNSSCSVNCPYCDKYYMQSCCCTTQNTGHEMPFEVLDNIFRQIEYSSVRKVNLLSLSTRCSALGRHTLPHPAQNGRNVRRFRLRVSGIV